MLIRTEADVVAEAIGNVYWNEDAKMVVGDTDLVKKFVAQLGLLTGGSRLGHVVIQFFPVQLDATLVDSTVGGTFSE